MVTIALDVNIEIWRATHLFGRAAILNFAGSHRASAIVRPSCKIRQYQMLSVGKMTEETIFLITTSDDVIPSERTPYNDQTGRLCPKEVHF